jgi:hypothetical protein
MKTHVQIVAILHIAYAVMGLIAAFIILSIFGVAGGIVVSQGEGTAAGIVGLVGLVIGSLLAILAVPGIIGGWGLLAGRGWARILVIILGILDLLHFPLGTALGIYTLWALLRVDETQSSGLQGMHA